MEKLIVIIMELNECNDDDEYRCHNGQCIPREFLINGCGLSECLDRSVSFAFFQLVLILFVFYMKIF